MKLEFSEITCMNIWTPEGFTIPIGVKYVLLQNTNLLNFLPFNNSLSDLFLLPFSEPALKIVSPSTTPHFILATMQLGTLELIYQ